MTLVMTTLLCLFLTCLHLLQEEGSVEVDALEDELEEDAPRPAHRSRSILVLVLVELPPIGTTRVFRVYGWTSFWRFLVDLDGMLQFLDSFT